MWSTGSGLFWFESSLTAASNYSVGLSWHPPLLTTVLHEGFQKAEETDCETAGGVGVRQAGWVQDKHRRKRATQCVYIIDGRMSWDCVDTAGCGVAVRAICLWWRSWYQCRVWVCSSNPQ
ncbi:hypothetical protein BDZ88DRAFT_25901 [Geranomyces variabilis]|nr:hypothetical protein BDZ88DRAFT_25901 [Geranomyces variabilis]